MPIRAVFLAVCLLFLNACGYTALHLNLRLEALDGLREGDPIALRDRTVGEVARVVPETAGGYLAELVIDGEYRDEITENARFVVTGHPDDPDRRRVEIRPSRTGTRPLADGATVRGSTERDTLFPLGEILRGFSEGFGLLRDRLDRFRSELRRLPESGEGRKLAEEWRRLMDEMQQAQRESEEALREDMLPKLQRELDELERKFRELPREPSRKPQTI